jgi:putative ABC transport system ATP-binding protein
MSLIEIKDVSRLYGFGDATTLALDEVNLVIEKGDFIALMGPSGSGKTTLMNIIGLLDRPSHGTYKLDGKDVSRLRPNRRARVRRDHIGFIFQSFQLLSGLTILENTALPLAYKGVRPARRLKAAGKALEQVGLSDREYYLPHQLSGGQVQRAAIARAIINSPTIIIADEPTGNLDTQSARVVMELLSELHKLGHTIIMVTHNPSLTRYANRILYMVDGSIVSDEASAIGELPDRVKKVMNALRKTKEEEDLANVSAVMREIPGASSGGNTKLPKKTRKASKTKKWSSRKKKEQK